MDPVFNAIAAGDHEELARYLEGGGDPCATNKDHVSLLMLASVAGDQVSVAKLLAAGAKVDATTPSGTTALMYAASRGHDDIVSQLINAEADVNHRAGDGVTPLMMASSKGQTSTIELLMKAGADPAQSTAKGFDAKDVAATLGLSNVLNVLLKESDRVTQATRDLLQMDRPQQASDDDAFRLLFGDPGMDALKELYEPEPKSTAPAATKRKQPLETKLPIEQRRDELLGEEAGETAEAAPEEEVEIPQEEINIDDFIGQKGAKQSLEQIIAVAKLNQARIKRDLPELKLSFHAVFTGSPGTGKTTFARFYAQEVKKIGMLSKGHLVEVSRADLVAEYQGQTAPKTMAVVKKALGGILFIDEAYALKGSKDDAFGQECIDTLVKAVEDHRKDLIVIFAGYENEMREFLHHNPGLKSRLPHLVHFADFTPEELLQIFDLMSGKHHLSVEPEAREEIAEQLMLARRGKSFGNGREVRNLIERALAQQSTRLARGNLDELSQDDLCKIIYSDVTANPDDLGTYAEVTGTAPTNPKSAMGQLEKLHGLDAIKSEIRQLSDYVRVTKARRGDGDMGDMTLHMVFTGPPGTGKTTVARLMGGLLKEVGVLSSGHLVETDRAGLVAEYMGQTAVKTRERIEESIGGVLFIDEAYTLTRGQDQYGREAVDVLMKCIEDMRSSFVVILSGYEGEMERFLQANPGLASRFPRVLHFPEFDDKTLLAIADSMAADDGFKITEKGKEAVDRELQRRKKAHPETFGNAREVRNLLEQSYKKHAGRMVKLGDPSKLDSETLNTLTHDDFM